MGWSIYERSSLVGPRPACRESSLCAMAYDEALADRIRDLLVEDPQVNGLITEERMFGGLAFMLHGHMAVAAAGKGGLMLRCDPADTDGHLVAGAEPMEMHGRNTKGWLRVNTDDLPDDALARWLAVGTSYAAALPPK